MEREWKCVKRKERRRLEELDVEVTMDSGERVASVSHLARREEQTRATLWHELFQDSHAHARWKSLGCAELANCVFSLSCACSRAQWMQLSPSKQESQDRVLCVAEHVEQFQTQRIGGSHPTMWTRGTVNKLNRKDALQSICLQQQLHEQQVEYRKEQRPEL